MAAGPLPLVLWPIRFTASTYVLRSTQGGSAQNLTFPSSGALTPGRNYWMSGDGQADADGGVGGVGDLLQMLDDCITSHTSISGYTYTVSLTSAFLLSIVSGNTGDSWDLLWSHANTTLDEAIFGFANATATASAGRVTSTMMPQGIWRPEMMVTFDSRDRQPTVGGVTAAISGLQRTARLALPRKHRDLRWSLLPQTKALEEYELASEPAGSFERMWNDAISLGRPIRYYPDETSRTSSSYSLYVPREVEWEKALQRDDRYNLRWQAELNLRAA